MFVKTGKCTYGDKYKFSHQKLASAGRVEEEEAQEEPNALAGKAKGKGKNTNFKKKKARVISKLEGLAKELEGNSSDSLPED
jgi:hypothetical protein